MCPRKFHSATGLILGVMLLAHFSISFFGFWPAVYQRIISLIHRHSNALICAEIVLIFIPLLIHIGYGLRFLWKEGITLPNEKHHYGTATRFLWQRLSAIVLLLFIAFHVATLHLFGFHLAYDITHWSGLQRYAEGGLFSPQEAFASTQRGVRTFWNEQDPANPGNLLIAGFYLVAVLAAAYHLANGISTAAMVWDVTPDSSSQADRVWSVCKISGIALALVGLGAWVAFTIA